MSANELGIVLAIFILLIILSFYSVKQIVNGYTDCSYITVIAIYLCKWTSAVIFLVASCSFTKCRQEMRSVSSRANDMIDLIKTKNATKREKAFRQLAGRCPACNRETGHNRYCQRD